MKRNEFSFNLVQLIIIVMTAFVLMLLFPVTIWVGGSVITSAIKSSTNQCDQTLWAEKVFDGYWFCLNK